jgi:hypothetical protein
MVIADRLRELISHHLLQIARFDPFAKFPGVKSANDFLKLIGNDPAFAPFDLAREKYIAARVGGNLITSIHRKIGDLYEDITQEILSTTLGISRESLAYSLDLTIGKKKQTRSTDGRILLDEIQNLDTRNRVSTMIPLGSTGLALEIRSCYQIGDSKRIQADRDMALALRKILLSPVMLVYCETSLRSPIIRLSQYWDLKEGNAAFDYIHQLTGFDLLRFLNENKSFIKERMEMIFQKF